MRGLSYLHPRGVSSEPALDLHYAPPAPYRQSLSIPEINRMVTPAIYNIQKHF